MEQVAEDQPGGSPSSGRYDIRGLAEPDAVAPRTAVVSGNSAELDAAELSTRQINLEIRRVLAEEGVTEVTLLNPRARHSIAVGLLLRCRIRIDGSLGYFACGLIDGPEIHITGRVGWSAAENMMSGVVVVDKNAGSLTGAGLRGGDVVVRGHVGARTGIDQKGGTILVGGNAGSMTASRSRSDQPRTLSRIGLTTKQIRLGSSGIPKAYIRQEGLTSVRCSHPYRRGELIMSHRIRLLLLLAIVASTIAIAVAQRHALDVSLLTTIAADTISIPKP